MNKNGNAVVNARVKSFLKKNVFAVVGVSRNREKYGYKIYKDLKEAGYKVYPINPHTEEINGEKCYPNLKSLPERPEVVDIVVPPKITERILKECKDLGIKRVWLQPGSESEEAIIYCKNNGVEAIYNMCIMVARKASKKV